MFVSAKIAALVASAVALAGGTVGVSALNKTVSLTVDGSTRTVSGLATNVSDVLRNEGITLSDRDLVFPATDTAVANGSQVSVQYARKVVAIVDGRTEEFYTTARTIDAALAEWSAHDLSAARLSLSRSVEIGREGIELVATTPKHVVLVVAGKKTDVTTTAPTVAHLLVERHLTIDADDKLSADLAAALTPDLKVTLTRIEERVVSEKVTVRYQTVSKKSASIWKGETKVVSAGKNGRATLTYRVVLTNGKQTDKTRLSRVVTTQPTDAVVLVGTKTSPSGAGINLARAAMWDRIARCESGGNWHINTGNGYYGGLQFSAASWRANGGRDFAALPHQASRAEQITVANRYYAKAGLSPWSCRGAA